MTNTSLGRLRARTDIWHNNELIDYGTPLHTVYYIFDKLYGSIAVDTLCTDNWNILSCTLSEKKEYLCRDTFLIFFPQSFMQMFL